MIKLSKEQIANIAIEIFAGVRSEDLHQIAEKEEESRSAKNTKEAEKKWDEMMALIEAVIDKKNDVQLDSIRLKIQDELVSSKEL